MQLTFLINIIFIIVSILNPIIGYTYSIFQNNNPITVDTNKNNKTVPYVSLSSMLDKVLPAVVNIYVEGNKYNKFYIPKEFKHFFIPNIPRENNKYFEGLGSGVIIDSKKGYVITNSHVINKAVKIKIQLYDGREFNAKIVGNDELTDIAVLKLDSCSNLNELKIADSDVIKVGDFVVAIGNPFGLGQTVTSGIVSALGRSGLSPNGLENFIQTDASINKGNSGGALVNMNGELIGINTAILAPNGGNIGIGFAIPSNIVRSLSNQIIKFGEVKRGKLGVIGTELTNDIAKAFKLNIRKGAFVNEVILGSAANKAGIIAGDVIISLNGQDIKSFSELKVKICTALPGQIITLGILRNKTILNVNVKLDDYLISYPGRQAYIEHLKGALFKDTQLDNGLKGVRVEKVLENSPAYFIGLKEGDIIVGVNKDKIQNLNELRKILDKKSDILALNIIRGESNIFLFFKKND